MSGNGTSTKLISYRGERALENAAFVRGLRPTRFAAVLLPVWSVEIQASILDAADYRLLDRYLERGIAEGGLDTESALADFFGLAPVVVRRALWFLTTIGHVAGDGHPGGRLRLTDLGLHSLRDNRRYTVTHGDRRKLYFDAATSYPLTRPYYDSKVVTLLSHADAVAGSLGERWPRFTMLAPRPAFRFEALAELAANDQRDRFNLPARIDNPKPVGSPEDVYLPIYLIRALDGAGQVRHLAYSQVASTGDDDLSELVERSPAAVGLLATEEEDGRAGRDRDQIDRWLDRLDLGDHTPAETGGGWTVTLPPRTFGESAPLALAKVGSYVMLNGSFVRVWCNDASVRRRVLLERIRSYIGSRSRQRTDRATVDERIAAIARQLDLGHLDTQAVQAMAADTGDKTLANQLARL
jgi:hypothetical protein